MTITAARPTITGARRGRRAGLAAIGTLLGLAVAVGVGGKPASAHDELIASTPMTGEALDAAPAEVALRFSDDILTIGAVILVVDDDDTSWVAGETTLAGPAVTVDLLPDMPTGHYEVRWRVVSSDGHPIAGIVPFTVSEAGDAVPAPDAGSASTPPSTPVATAPSVGDGDDASAAGDPPLRLIAVGTVGAGAALGLLLLISTWRRRRRRP